MKRFWRDEFGMDLAIGVAKRGKISGMRPFGSVVVDERFWVVGKAAGSETPIRPTRHSEILAIDAACREVGGLLQGCTLYQTLEPCHMCLGAIKHAKISRVVWGCSRSDLPLLFRACRISARDLLQDTTYPPEVVTGVLRQECIALFDSEIQELEQRTRLVEAGLRLGMKV